MKRVKSERFAGGLFKELVTFLQKAEALAVAEEIARLELALLLGYWNSVEIDDYFRSARSDLFDAAVSP